MSGQAADGGGGQARPPDLGRYLDGDQSRAARRAFIRDRHPDRGGDPAAFIAGLRALDGPGPAGGEGWPAVTVVRRPGWVARRARAAARRLRHGPPPPRVR